MIRFVKALNSMDKIRKFLMSKNLLDELSALELETDNFVEAARIAQLKGDLLLEASVWEKAGSFVKATKLVILDVITKSLWSHGSKGWPPKSFPKSEVHFTKAKELAKNVSGCFYNSVCSELHLWDGKPKKFSKLFKLFVEAEKSQDIRLAFLSLRSLLDLHLAHENSMYLFETDPLLDLGKQFHEMIVQGVVSLNTLVHIWVQWREAAIRVCSSLCEEFCHDYLGVRREDNKDIYYVLNPHAYWIGGFRTSLKKSSGEQCLMSYEEYTSCASGYWQNEIFSVGKAVVVKLDSLLRSSRRQMLSPETRGRISLLVFEVIKSLKQTSCIKENWNIESYMYLVEEWFWDAIFPLDSKNRATPCILPMVDCPAGAELVDELLNRILRCTNGKFTYGQLGRLSMILLLSGKLPDNLFEKIKNFAENMPPWAELFASLKVFFGGFERISMVVKFHKALQSTYEANWMQEPDYMTPHCYLYLLDLLTFFASSCIGSVGYMITTRSVLAEVVKLRGCKTFLDSPLDQMLLVAGTPTSLQSLFEFIVNSIEELLCNKNEMFKWIDKCSRSVPDNFRHQMVLRLAITLCLAYFNRNSDICSPGKFLSGHYDISHNLPEQFSSKIQLAARYSGDRGRSLISFVDAFASIEDPLVVISAKKDSLVFPPSRFFFFCCEEIRDRDHVMEVLFPKVTSTDVTALVASCTDVPLSGERTVRLGAVEAEVDQVKFGEEGKEISGQLGQEEGVKCLSLRSGALKAGSELKGLGQLIGLSLTVGPNQKNVNEVNVVNQGKR